MKVCRKFKNSIIGFFSLVLYAGCMAALFLLLGVENWQVLKLSRTSVVMAFTYIIFGILMVRTYGRYDIGVRKSRPIIISLALATILDDLITYFVLIIMNTNDANGRAFRVSSLGFLFLAVLAQILIISLMTHAGNSFFFLVTPPERTLVVTSSADEDEKVCRAVGIFHKRYTVVRTAHFDDELLMKYLLETDSVFFYDVPAGERSELMKFCYKNKVNVYCNPDIEDILLHNSNQVMFSDMPFYKAEFVGMTFEQRAVKRLMDIIVSALMLIITSPVFLVTAIAIKRNDGGKIFFRQERATIRGRVFRIYKFRTMKENTENRSVTKDDDRITSVGKVLRRYRIDELPQFINIIRGDMSLVGPRPEMLENVDEYTKAMPEFTYRLRVKAGLTGYAQVMGKYNTTSRDKLILDLMYIENFSILNDIRLLFQTLTVLFTAEDSTEGF